MRRAIALLVFIFLAMPAFAEQSWTLPTFGAIENKPAFFEDKIVSGSQDGTVEIAFYRTGNLITKTDVGEPINEVRFANNQIVAGGQKSIIIMGKNGSISKRINETVIYGFETGADYIYATTGNGLAAYDYNGNMIWVLKQDGNTLTEPLLLSDRIIFGSGEDLVVVARNNGTEKTRINAGAFWQSKPAIDNRTDMVYIGSTDGKMYAISLGAQKVAWTYQSDGWIMSDPLYDKGSLYFGSNDGNMYAVGSMSGALLWKKKIPEALQGSLELVAIGNREMVLSGSNDNKVYLFDPESGNVMLSFSVGGWVHNPTFYSGMLFFGSYDGSLYAYVADRSCSIESPAPGDVVGYSVFNVSGSVFSQNSGAKALVRINNGTWNEAALSGNNWTYAVDPNQYDFGKLFIECKAADASGEERKSFTYVVILRDMNAVKEKMKVLVPTSVTAGKSFLVKATDQDGAPLDDFTVIVDKKTSQGTNGAATVRIDGTGTYNMLVRKTGYDDEVIAISSGYDIVMYGLIGVVALAVLGAAFYLFFYKRK